MRSLKSQLLISHLVLVAILSVLLAGAVTEFSHLGQSIDRIVRDNYDSVIAAENMKETLERQDSAATFFLAGQREKSRAQYQANWPVFQHWSDIEAHNITEVGEQQMSDEIRALFPLYRAHIERLLYGKPAMTSEASRVYYFSDLEPRFLQLKGRAQDVLDVNQAAILRADRRARDEAARSAVIGTGLSLSAFVVSWVLAVRMVQATLEPLRKLAGQAEAIGSGNFDHRIRVERSDEIGLLADAFNLMARRLREARRVQAERLERAERMSDTALDSLTDPVIVADQDARVVFLNRAAQQMFHLASPAFPVQSAEIIPDPRIVAEVSAALRKKAPTREEEAGFITRDLGGKPRSYRVRSAPMRDGQGLLIGAVTVLEDVTHLRELDRLKTEFIGVASHELRTPVTSLVLSVDLLAEGVGGKLTPDQELIIQAQRADLSRLQHLMGDLLDLSRLQDRDEPADLAPADPNAVAQSAVLASSLSASAKGVDLGMIPASGPPPVPMDRARIGRVLANLLDNAIRHTPAGGSVLLTVQRDHRNLTYTVEDTGSGIPGDYLDRLFEPFVQVPGANRGGAGLGLAIAQKIVQAHGGTIEVDSIPGLGSRFIVKLPSAGSQKLQRSRKDGANTVDR